MGYSKLTNVFIQSPNRSAPRTHKIDSIAIHTMAGNLSVEECGRHFAKSATEASSNYGIGSDGRIGCYVDEKDRAWTTSSAGVDNRAVTIEVASITSSEPFKCSDAAWNSLIKLCVDICRRNQISKLTWKNDKSYAIAAENGGPVTEQNMFLHRWFANKSCPGQYLYENHGLIAKEVNLKLGNYSSHDIIDNPTNPSTPITIDYKKLTPYILTLDRSTPATLPYDIYKKNGVVGVLLEAGFLYDTNRRKTRKFNNPNLYEQTQQLLKHNLPYGLYAICRAKNTVEAKDELHFLHIVTAVYPPKLGIWLKFEPSASKVVNNLILEVYEKELVRLGFKSKIGLYITREHLKQIDWNKFKDSWFLWIIDPVKNIDELDRLLDPEFFNIDERGL